VQSDRAGALSDDDRLLLEGLCGQIASAMESTRLLEEQRRSEAELSQALQIAKLAYWEYHVEKDLFHFNDQFYSLFHTTAAQEGGYQLSSAQYAGKFVYPDDLSMVGSEIERALNSTDRHYSRDLIHRIQYADGGVGYISVNINIDRDEQGRILRYYGANQDITATKLAELAVRRSEAELSQALQIAKLAYWEYDVEKDLFLFNDQFYAIFHTTAEQEGGYQLSSAQYAGKFVYPDDLSMVGSEIERALNSTDRHYSRDLVHRIQYADGGVGYISVNINIDRDEQGHILRYYGANQDITESKLAEVEMQRTQRFLDSIVENIPIMLFVKDAQDLRFVRWNKAGEDLMGFSRAEMLGKNDLDIVPLEEAELFMASDRQVLIDKEPLDIPEESLETRFKGIRTLHTRKIPILDQQGNAQYLLGISEDITDSKQAEAERERLITEQQTRAVQLQTAAEIGRVATSILNPDQLLSEIVELIAARLGVYHVAVFTVDESGRWALIRSATGEVGQQLKDRGQALGIRGQSIVGNAIQRRQPRIALDVGAEAVQFKDPLLPATRSEIALPLFVGDQVLGALDIQSTEPAAFDENSAIVLQSMADQIAVALNNAEKYQREQAQVEQTNRLMQIVIDLSEPTDRTELQNRLVRSALSLLDTDRAQVWLKGASGLELKAAQSIRPGADQSLAISQELADRVCHTGQPLRLDSPPLQAGYASRITDVPFNAALMMPISWQSQTTGVLSVMRSQPGRPFTQDDENSAQLLAAQASAALENIALSEHQQHRSVQLQTAAEVSRAASSILKLDELLPEAVELIRARFNFYYVGIFLADEAGRWAVLRAGTGEAGQQMLANAHQLEIGGASMISQCIVKQQARIALDVGEEAIRFDNPLLPLTRSEMALPLTSRGRIIGAMSIQSDQPAAFSPDDITVLQSMADQISNAVENARLYERVQVALGDTDQLLQASAELNVSQTYAEVLDVVRKYTTLGQDAQTIAINVFDRPWTDDQTPVWIELIGFFTRRPSGMEIGTRFPIALFPAAKALLRPDAPSVFEDLDTAQTDPNTHALFVQRLASKSVIFMPLVVGGQWFGYMNVLYPNPSQFNEADVRRLMAMVRQAAVAVQNLRHLAASQQALTETDASYRATQAIGRAQSVEAILEATTHVVDLLGMTRATLHVVTRRDIANVVTATDMYAFHQIAGQWVLQPSVKDAPISGAATIRSLQRQPDAVVIYADAQNPNSPMPDEARQTLLADALRGAIATSASLQNEVLGFLSFSGPQPLNEAAEQRLRLTIRTLSDQVAVALQNRLLFEQTRAALQEVDAINRRLTGEAWDTYLHQQTGQDVIWAADDDLAAPAYLAQLDDQLAAGEITLEPDPEDQSEATVTAPILLRGQPIGVLRMRTPLNAWNNDSEAVLTDIAGHIAQAVENARLIEQTQRTASRERMINEINARVRQTVTIDSILETAVKELGKSLTATHVFARVSRPETLEDGHDRTG
jgi:PAS domain S-box-containing protein